MVSFFSCLVICISLTTIVWSQTGEEFSGEFKSWANVKKRFGAKAMVRPMIPGHCRQPWTVFRYDPKDSTQAQQVIQQFIFLPEIIVSRQHFY
jgi:hypothetical protein